jgi:2-polyprenyl-3-methyl-5-hydroxy-6-metoxy-1,4-benzoquinol methylase
MEVIFTPIESCWICKSDRLDPVSKTTFDLSAFAEVYPDFAPYTGRSISLRRCRDCSFMQPEGLPAVPRFFDRLYTQEWSEDWIVTEFAARYKDFIYTGILRNLERRVPLGSRTLLDIGAHVGRFVYLASIRKWNVEGIELNPRTSSFAHQKTGVPVHRINAHELAVSGSAFSAVTITDVLEHIPFPMRILEQAREVLTPGGWIAVKVPFGRNQLLKETIRSRIKANYAADIATNLVHVNHFSPQSLRTALQETGFRNISLTVGAPELQDWRSKGWHSRKPIVSNWLANIFVLAAYGAAKVTPLGVSSPLAFNLQAFAQKP